MIMFTFKKGPRCTGLAAVGDPWPATDIKLKGKVVGSISPPRWNTPDNKWSAMFRINDTAEKCGWRWVRLKTRFDEESEAREFLKANFSTFTFIENLYSED